MYCIYFHTYVFENLNFYLQAHYIEKSTSNEKMVGSKLTHSKENTVEEVEEVHTWLRRNLE